MPLSIAASRRQAPRLLSPMARPVPALLAGLLAAALLSACATPGDSRPRAKLLDSSHVTTQPLLASEAAGGAATPVFSPRWWQRLGDAQLDQLINTALADGPSVKLAAARLNKARALAEVSDAAGQPNLSARLDVSRQRFSEHGMVPPPLAGNFYSVNETALDFSYELDLWGRHRASLDAALSQVEAAKADSEAASLLLAAAVARSYVQLDRLYHLLDIATATVTQRQQQLSMTERRVAAGLDARSEALSSETMLAAATQDVALINEQLKLVRHQLAALAGQGPTLAETIRRPVLVVAVLTPPTVLPADLLGRRPDLVASRWRVEAARRDSDAARAQFYPNVNLVALVGLSSIGMGHFFDAGSAVTGIGPAVRLPLFDGGRLRSNLASRNADADMAIEQYNQTLIEAVRDVADQVASWRGIAEQQRAARRALALAAESRQLAQLRAKAGLSSELVALNADSVWLDRRRVDAELNARALDAEIGLVRALGGAYTSTTEAGRLDTPSTSSSVARSPQ